MCRLKTNRFFVAPVRYLSLEIRVSYQLLNRIADFYELGVSSTRIIPIYQCI